MKAKIALLSVVLVAFASTGVFAQGIQLGVKGGTNIFKIQGQSFDQQFRFGYSLGGFAEINLNKHFGIQPELMWNQSKTQTTGDFNVIYQGSSFTNVTLNYLSVPVLLNFRPTKVLSILAGPQFGILLSQNDNLFISTKEAFKKGDFSVVGGAQLNLAWFKLGARYFIGLNNLNDLGSQDKWTNQGFQLYAGIRIL